MSSLIYLFLTKFQLYGIGIPFDLLSMFLKNMFKLKNIKYDTGKIESQPAS